MTRVLAYRVLPGYLLLMVRDYICLLWVLHVGLDLVNVSSDKEQMHCAQLGDLLVPGGLLFRGRCFVLVYPLVLCKPVYLTLMFRVFRGAGGVEPKQRSLPSHLL